MFTETTCSNRTFMELKLSSETTEAALAAAKAPSSNRTFMELK